MLFEACLSGKLHHVPRRPHDRERNSLIKSGSVFIYEENASGIKRWTDGVAWSPSRILGNFLIYRELEKPFAPGEKKRAMKRKRSFQADGQNSSRQGSDGEDDNLNNDGPPTPPSPTPPSPPKPLVKSASSDPTGGAHDNDREMERQLIGSLVDSYGFRPDGLVKKTMSVSMNGVSHHLVSYYKIDDVKHRNLMRPIDDARLAQLTVRPELYLKQNFRTPVEETEHYVVNPESMHAHPGYGYGAMMNEGGGYGMRPGQYMPSQGYQMYGAPSSAPTYGANPATMGSWHASAMHPTQDGYNMAQSQYAQNSYYGRAAPPAPMPNGIRHDVASPALSHGYHQPYASASPAPSSVPRDMKPEMAALQQQQQHPYLPSPRQSTASLYSGRTDSNGMPATESRQSLPPNPYDGTTSQNYEYWRSRDVQEQPQVQHQYGTPATAPMMTGHHNSRSPSQQNGNPATSDPRSNAAEDLRRARHSPYGQHENNYTSSQNTSAVQGGYAPSSHDHHDSADYSQGYSMPNTSFRTSGLVGKGTAAPY